MYLYQGSSFHGIWHQWTASVSNEDTTVFHLFEEFLKGILPLNELLSSEVVFLPRQIARSRAYIYHSFHNPIICHIRHIVKDFFSAMPRKSAVVDLQFLMAPNITGLKWPKKGKGGPRAAPHGTLENAPGIQLHYKRS
jgi:hypothetical protein